MVPEAVYEQDFFSYSYGFRPGRSAHQALGDVLQGLMEMGGGCVLEVDIQGYFDTMDHGHLRRILDQRVRDGILFPRQLWCTRSTVEQRIRNLRSRMREIRTSRSSVESTNCDYRLM